MKVSVALIPLAALAILSINGVARAGDDGETRAMTYYQQQERCASVPKFSETPRPISQTTGDPEKDTYAYPVERVDTLCASKAAATDNKPALQPAPQMDASRTH